MAKAEKVPAAYVVKLELTQREAESLYALLARGVAGPLYELWHKMGDVDVDGNGWLVSLNPEIRAWTLVENV